MSVIRCRAQLTAACYDGRQADTIYPDGADDDGTWRRSDQTVVCDPCYIALGQPLLADLEPAIAAARAR